MFSSHQAFLFDGAHGILFVGQKGFNSCVGGDPMSRTVLQLSCRYTADDISIKWHYIESTKQLQLVLSPETAAAAAAADAIEGHYEGHEQGDEGAAARDFSSPGVSLCLRLFAFPQDASPHAVELAVCDPQDPGQQLIFVP